MNDDDAGNITGAPSRDDDENAAEETYQEASMLRNLPIDVTGRVHTFFDRLYLIPSYAFLHPATTKRRASESTLDEALALAMCALVSLRAESEDQDQSSSLRWVQSAEQIVWQHLECLTISRLQALLLIIHYRMETGRFQRAFMLTAMAARFAAAMRLNHEHPELNAVAREVRRRVVWSLKLVERYFSIGLPEFEVCPYETIYLELPCREDEFNLAKHQQGATPHELKEFGVYRLCIRLESIRRDIMKLSRSIALCDEAFPLLPKLVRDLERELEAVGAQIPNDPNLTSSGISELMDNPWLPRYIFLHLSWHQCHCDLYRLLLPGYQEAAPAVVLHNLASTYTAAAQQQCLHHAASIIRIITSLNEHSEKPCLLEFDTAICVYHAIRLTFFIAICGRGEGLPTKEFAESRALLCLAALRRFFTSSVLVRPIIQEIERCTQAFLSREDEYDRSMSSNPDLGRETSAQKLSAMAKARQRLAIHSLLLQVECNDDDHDEGPSPTSASIRSQEQQHAHTDESSVIRSPVQGDTLHPLEIAPDAIESHGSLPSASIVSPTYSDSSTVLFDQSGLDPVAPWDFNAYSPELPNDLQFPLFPWFSHASL